MPTTEAAVVVHRRYPEVPGRGGLLLSRARWLVAGHFDDERARQAIPGVPEPYEEVGVVLLGLTLVRVRDGESKVVVLHVRRDLRQLLEDLRNAVLPAAVADDVRDVAAFLVGANRALGDRKSTRLNSSHVRISYAVFCLKKKKKT